MGPAGLPAGARGRHGRRSLTLAALAAALVLVALPAAASAAPSLAPVGTFAQPVHVAAPPGDAARLFVVEKAGRVQLVVNGQEAATPFLDISAGVSADGERGLLSIAFAPDYAASGLFYVFYTDLGGDLVVREGQRSADPDRGDPGRVLFTIEHSSATNHNGGQLAFGPDGALYVGTGDGGGGQGDPGDDAQNPSSLLGKILRVDPRVSPSPQVWALGLRNPWRFSFDRMTGDMVIGDVGASANEEVDFAPAGTPAGRNYGWVRCEGDQPSCPAGTIKPVLDLAHPEYTGVIGGFVVRDAGLPTLLGRYVFGDLSKTTAMSVALGAETTPRAEPGLPVSSPSSFGEDACGHVYLVSLDGPVSRIQDGAAGPCAGAPPGQPAGGDTTPCTVRAVSRGTQRILRRGRRLRLTLSANEACAATLRAERFRTKRVTLRPGVKRIVRLTPTKRGLRRMRRALARTRHDRLRITVTISARDPAGNRSTARVRPKLR